MRRQSDRGTRSGDGSQQLAARYASGVFVHEEIPELTVVITTLGETDVSRSSFARNCWGETVGLMAPRKYALRFRVAPRAYVRAGSRYRPRSSSSSGGTTVPLFGDAFTCTHRRKSGSSNSYALEDTLVCRTSSSRSAIRPT